jgi:hypothetical protein
MTVYFTDDLLNYTTHFIIKIRIINKEKESA